MTKADLLDSVLAPAMPLARCRGRGELFDGGEKEEPAAAVRARHSEALALCRRCREIGTCESWIDGLPKSQIPRGVVAGRRYAYVNGTVMRIER